METKEMVALLRHVQRLNAKFDTYERRGDAQTDFFWIEVGKYYANAYDEGDKAVVLSNKDMDFCIEGSIINVAHALTKHVNRHGLKPRVIQ